MAGRIVVEIEQSGPSASEGTARTHRVSIDRPIAKGGQDSGPMGGELMLMALGGCFMSNLLAAIRARDAPVSRARVGVEGTIDGAPERFEAIVLTVTADYEDPELMQKLVTIAERACIVTNTLRPALQLSIVLEPARRETVEER